eukprot:519922_1
MLPLHRFTAHDICDHIEKWVLNDINHKTHLAKTKELFANQKLSGQNMIDLELSQIEQVLKNDLSPFITQPTLDIMLRCYDQWKNEIGHPYEEISSKTAQEIADILFHYPLNSLLLRIKNENIDGSQLIDSLATEQHNRHNINHIIFAETGWHDDEVRQLLSILFRHHTWTQSEFEQNWDRVWAKQEYNALSPRIISTIKAVILDHDVEEIHYKIKNAHPIDAFSDCIINMVDDIINETETEDHLFIKSIYEGIADCFIFYRESKDLILELQ